MTRGSGPARRTWRPVLFVAFLALPGCVGDETARAYGASDHVWTLTELNGRPVDQTLTLRFTETGRIAGTAHCNSYSAVMSAPYPWFGAREIVTTNRACPAQGQEDTYLRSLAAMTQSEVSGQVLILRDDAGREMVFRAAG